MNIDSSATVRDYRPRYPLQVANLKWVPGAFQLFSSLSNVVAQDNWIGTAQRKECLSVPLYIQIYIFFHIHICVYIYRNIYINIFTHVSECRRPVCGSVCYMCIYIYIYMFLFFSLSIYIHENVSMKVSAKSYINRCMKP